MIGTAYQSKATQAVLGPYRSQLIPAVLYLGWLDAAGALIAMTDTSTTHDVFTPNATGVTTTDTIDAGTAGTGWTIHAVGLFDGPTGDLIADATLATPLSPAAGAPLSITAGALTFSVAA